MEKLDPLTAEGRRVLDEIKEREGQTSCPPKRVDFQYLSSLGHIAGNPFYEVKPEPGDDAA